MKKLNRAQLKVLRAMYGGHSLKSHRELDGTKLFKLQSAADGPRIVEPGTVAALREQGLIDSNKKFPVATFWLTELGRALAADS